MLVGRSYGGWYGVVVGVCLIALLNYLVQTQNRSKGEGEAVHSEIGNYLFIRLSSDLPTIFREECVEIEDAVDRYIQCELERVKSEQLCDLILRKLFDSEWALVSKNSSCRTAVKLTKGEVDLDVIYFARSGVVRFSARKSHKSKSHKST